MLAIMKNHTGAWVNAMFFAWLAAALFFDFLYLTLFGLERSDDFIIIILHNIFSFVFSFTSSLIFVYPFKNFTDKLIHVFSKLAFAITTLIYGLIIVAFAAICMTNSGIYAIIRNLSNFEKLIIVNAAVNGFVYGLLYHSYRKSTE
jgi:hypothetical protein